MLKSGLLVIVAILWLSLSLNAQTEPNAAPGAYKFAEFGPIGAKAIAAKMASFYEFLKKESTAQGYVINYGSPKEIKARRAAIMKAITWRDYDGPRITFVDGPFEKRIRTVMWIVPAGAGFPTP